MSTKNKKQKINKGTPTAVLLSILIHTALFLLAGLFVVFTVVKQKEVEFEPPKPVERPKMKLKKPKVKIKKSSKPKPTTHIVTKVQKASMPDIQLPEMSGMGESLGAGIGGFDLMPDLGEVSVFGSGQTVGNDFVGTFYDFKRDRTGKPLMAGMDPDKYHALLMKFFRNGWKPSVFSRYYRSPKKLYATTFMVPPMFSTAAPSAFGEPDTGGWLWAVHYQGQLVYKEDITFRFWGFADDIMLVRVDGKVVLSACWHDRPDGARGGITSQVFFSPIWQTSSPDSFRYWLGNNSSVVGDWITLKAGEPLDMEVLIGESPGGIFCSMLLVEVKGEKYEKGPQGNPVLPIFKTAELSRDLQDAIIVDLVPGEACVTNGPVFSDYDTGTLATTNKIAETETPPAQPEGKAPDEMRDWTIDGKVLKAKFVATIGGNVVLKNAREKQRKVPLEKLSDEDRRFVELARPPVFKIDFSRKSSQRTDLPSPYNGSIPPTILDYVFTAKLKQTSAGSYNHELHVEFFAIGREVMGDKYILLDRQESSFVPSAENKRSFSFSGKTVSTCACVVMTDMRGDKYYGYLVVVTDERGKIIQHAASNEWLFENLDNLRKLHVGNYMDKTCSRAYPTPPKAVRY